LQRANQRARAEQQLWEAERARQGETETQAQAEQSRFS
jgi:hypothetical protein